LFFGDHPIDAPISFCVWATRLLVMLLLFRMAQSLSEPAACCSLSIAAARASWARSFHVDGLADRAAQLGDWRRGRIASCGHKRDIIRRS
jgi:hypothetical protein